MQKMFRLISVLMLLVSSGFPLAGQLPLPRNIQAAYVKGTRSPDGTPGPKYWQNTADYDIRIRFEPASRKISGTVAIEYDNQSPDTLREMWFKLYPNLYKKGVARNRGIDPADVSDGVQIGRIMLNGSELPASRYFVNGTNMRVAVPAVLPGKTAQISVEYSYILNKGSHNRTGEVDQGAWFIAYFFPRIAVYDDIDGWNRNPYLGDQEFYNDFCNFNLAVTVPRDYIVWATGDLQNCDAVFTPEYCERLARAEREDGYLAVIDTADLAKGRITAQSPENTFRFSAQWVTDVAVAISNHYVWNATSLTVDPATGRRTRVDAVFNPAHQDYVPVVEDARKTVDFMSSRFPRWPFPYPHITVFDGLDQMEYPMMVNDNPVEDRAESIELTDHEIFHTMFPFYMGINETKYGWMDEGWATIGEWLISPMIDSSIVDDYGMDRYEKTAGTELDLPITTLSTQQSGLPFFTNSYPKPALGYLYVKDMLGDERFFKGLHHYLRSWNGKHPMPYDFFYSMNAGSGVNLNWFWKRWFFDEGVPDLAIAQVKNKRKRKCITVVSKGNKPVPIDLTIQFSDGSEQKLHRSVAVWEREPREVRITFTTRKTVQKILLGSTYVPDTDKSDNVYPALH